MELPTATRFWNRLVLYLQSSERWLMRVVGIAFVGLIACGSLTLNSSSGYGTEGLLTSLSSSQAAALPNTDVETKQGISPYRNSFRQIFLPPAPRLDCIRWTTGVEPTPRFPSAPCSRR